MMKLWYDAETETFIPESDLLSAYKVDARRGFVGDFVQYLSVLSHQNGGPLFTFDERIEMLKEAISELKPDAENYDKVANTADQLCNELSNAFRIYADYAWISD